MATNKNQHFVPRCYLRQFTVMCEDKAINLYNIDRDKFIQGAPVKNQCSGDYFYGQDPLLESAIQTAEQGYGLTIRAILGDNYILTNEHSKIIRLFWLLQYLRTEAASKRFIEMSHDMNKLIGSPEYNFRIEIKEAVQDAMKTYAEALHFLLDLKVCLVKNKTSIPFVTSDDPAVMTNRWHFHNTRKTGLSFGLNSAGAIMLLPLSPRIMCIIYDGDMYSISNNNGWSAIKNAADIDALNQHQFLNCRANIFVQEPADFPEIQNAFHRVRSKRPPTRHRLNYAVPDKIENDSIRYVVVDWKQGVEHEQALIHMQTLHAQPVTWPSIITWRHNAHYYSNSTGIGHIRKYFTNQPTQKPFEKYFAFKR